MGLGLGRLCRPGFVISRSATALQPKEDLLCRVAQSHAISMPCLDTRTLGGLCFVRIRIELNPPVTVKTPPVAMSRPSLLVGSGSRIARMITTAPKRVMPPAIKTATHSLRESPLFNPISSRVCLLGSIPTFASATMTMLSRLRYAVASCASHPCSEVRIVRSLISLAFRSSSHAFMHYLQYSIYEHRACALICGLG